MLLTRLVWAKYAYPRRSAASAVLARRVLGDWSVAGTVGVTVTTPNGTSPAGQRAQFSFVGGAGVDWPSRLTGPLETVSRGAPPS